MPLYTSVCSTCGEQHSYIRKVDERADTPECCGIKTTKVIDSPMISAMAWTGWKAVHLADGKNGGKGTWIEDGAAYSKYLKDNNKLPESEGAAEAELQRKNREAAHDKIRREAVIKAVQQHTS